MTESIPTHSRVLSILSASRAGNVDQVAESLRRGGDVNARVKDGRTALMLAASGAHPPVVELLLKSGAQADLKDDRGRTALILSSLNWNSEVVALLLEGGATPNVKDDNGRTALQAAINSKGEDVVRLLLSYGADPDETDLDGFSLTRHLLSRKEFQMARLLIEHGGQGEQEAESISSIEEGSTNNVRLLLNRGVSPNTRQTNGETALMLAAERGFVDIAKSLLDKGADIEAMDKMGCTALMHGRPLFSTWFSPEARAQIRACADDERQHDRYYEAEFNRRAAQQVDIVRLLVRRGADIDARNKRGETALIQAASPFGYYSFEIVRELLAHNANVHLKGGGGNALTSAVTFGDREIAEALLAKGADANSTTRYESSDYESYDMPILIWATMCGFGEIVKLLLSHRADPNLRCGEVAALHVAAILVDTQTFKELIKKGANLKRDGAGALAVAKVNSAIAQQLINYGIKEPKIIEGQRRTTLDVATLTSKVRLSATPQIDRHKAAGIYPRFVPGGLPGSGKRR